MARPLSHSQQGLEMTIIRIVSKNSLSLIASAHDVVQSTGIMNAGSSGHDSIDHQTTLISKLSMPDTFIHLYLTPL